MIISTLCYSLNSLLNVRSKICFIKIRFSIFHKTYAMKLLKTKSYVLIFFISIFSFISCEKEEPVLDREKFLGSYNVSESCTSGTYSFAISITESSTSDDIIIINNFADYQLNIRATVDGSNITFNETQQGVSFSGSGNISGNSLTIIYTASVSGATENCTKTCIRQ